MVLRCLFRQHPRCQHPHVDGGTHIEGLKTVLTRTLKPSPRSWANARNRFQSCGENIREGLTAVLSVKVSTGI